MIYNFISGAISRSRAVLTILVALLLGGISSYATCPAKLTRIFPFR